MEDGGNGIRAVGNSPTKDAVIVGLNMGSNTMSDAISRGVHGAGFR